MFYLKQSTASQKLTVKLVDAVDGYTPETSITSPTITLSKAGDVFAGISDGTWAELANGLYTVLFNVTDSNTLAGITIHVEKTGCRNYEEKGYVLPANVYDSWFSTDKLQVDLTQVNGAAQTATLDTIKAETVLIVEDTGITLPAQIATGGAGTGAITFTYTVKEDDGSGDAIPDVQVWVTSDEAGNTIIASGTTDASGEVVFYLDADTYYIWRQKSGINFDNPDLETIS